MWQDTRTADLVTELAADGGQDRFRPKTGLPLATYFAGPKIRWMLDHVEGLAKRAESGDILFGTMDSFVLWHLTGGPSGGVHVSDVTNASRTLLMDLETLEWDDDLLAALGVPRTVLPEIRSSSEVYGASIGPAAGVPIAGILGDQQAALFGQACYEAGEAKNTYGTGCFMLLNTGEKLVPSVSGLLTTVGYQLGTRRLSMPSRARSPSPEPLSSGCATTSASSSRLPKSKPWRPRSRTTAGCISCRRFPACLPPTGAVMRGASSPGSPGTQPGRTLPGPFSKRPPGRRGRCSTPCEPIPGLSLTALKVDGGMVQNELLMQFQADVLGVPVIRPTVSETTALGAAYAAGLATGFWAGFDDLRGNWGEDKRWMPAMDETRRESSYAEWKKAVTRTFDWV